MAKTSKSKRKPSSKRFTLVHLEGGVEIRVFGKQHKNYEELAEAARKFIKTDEYREGYDNLFYLVTQKNRLPYMGSFDSADLEEQDSIEEDGFCNDCMVEHLDGKCPHKKPVPLKRPVDEGFGRIEVDMRPSDASGIKFISRE